MKHQSFNKILFGVLKMENQCVNKKDFIYFDNIDDIDESNLVRLKNGACWHIESLIEYIKKKHGKNDATGLDNYPSEKLWEPEDLREIFDNAYSRDVDFEDWYFSGGSSKTAGYISDKTLQVIDETASILLSKGKYFDKKFEVQLLPEEKQIWKKYTIGPLKQTMTAYSNVDPSDRIIFKDVEYKIETRFKKDALNNMYFYYKTLSEQEKDSIKYFYNDIEKDLSNCLRGNYCVFTQGAYLEQLYNDVKELSN